MLLVRAQPSSPHEGRLLVLHRSLPVLRDSEHSMTAALFFIPRSQGGFGREPDEDPPEIDWWILLVLLVAVIVGFLTALACLIWVVIHA